jgi:squalene-associated FAD-dependent desaturase
MADPQSKTVAIVGGGLAGISAGCALADAGYKVSLFERRPYLGGRASSYEHPGTGETVDNCQHVLLGCCTNLIDLYRRFGAEDQIRWFTSLTFIEPGGRQSQIAPSMLPAPFHSAPSFFTASSLSLMDKLAIARAMLALMRALPEDTEENFEQWLHRHGQTARAIERFWKPVLVSAINEDLDRISVRYGAQVFRESFLKSAAAGRMGVPRVPLTDLYSRGAEYIRARGGDVRLRASVEAVRPVGARVAVQVPDGTEQFDCCILAVPYFTIAKLLPEDKTGRQLSAAAEKFESSPITGIHLWFDRKITDLPHAVLLDRTIQWMFQKSKLIDSRAGANSSAPQGSYLELVVSASKSLVSMKREEIIDLALRELAEFFPAVKDAKLLKAAVIKEVHATYSAQPLSDRLRPSATTSWPNVFLAGDWVSTGWPATMEGAVRSGYNAAEALTRAAGGPQRFRVADLVATGLMKLFD